MPAKKESIFNSGKIKGRENKIPDIIIDKYLCLNILFNTINFLFCFQEYIIIIHQEKPFVKKNIKNKKHLS